MTVLTPELAPTSSPASSPVRIDVYFDPICPWCYIGKRRLQRAIALRPALDITLNWKPFLLNPDMPAEGMAQDRYLLHKFGSEQRVRRLLGALEEVGQSEQIDFNFDTISQTPSTHDAHRLVHYAGSFGLASTMVEMLFHGFFVEGRNIGDFDELSALGRQAGLESGPLDAYLDSTLDQEWVIEQNNSAHRLGINGVPCFMLNGSIALQGAQQPQTIARLFDTAIK